MDLRQAGLINYKAKIQQSALTSWRHAITWAYNGQVAIVTRLIWVAGAATTRDPFYQYGLTLIPGRISN